ncbi:MAG: hypothetical protein L6Q35_16560 [Phycisphaerales bacterium]|nr:hypothetical protein [Phycisphaerales bacterium]
MAKTIGGAEVREAERQAVLLSSVLAAIDEHGQGALCFLPRHALRVSDAFGTTTYVLCFECRWVEIHSEPAGKPRTVRMVALRTEPQKLFEEEVQRLGLPRPPDVGAPSRARLKGWPDVGEHVGGVVDGPPPVDLRSSPSSMNNMADGTFPNRAGGHPSARRLGVRRRAPVGTQGAFRINPTTAGAWPVDVEGHPVGIGDRRAS